MCEALHTIVHVRRHLGFDQPVKFYCKITPCTGNTKHRKDHKGAEFLALMSSILMLILILSVNNTQLNIFSLTAIRASFYSCNHALSDVGEIRGK